MTAEIILLPVIRIEQVADGERADRCCLAQVVPFRRRDSRAARRRTRAGMTSLLQVATTEHDGK